jgi:hypothetical protein
VVAVRRAAALLAALLVGSALTAVPAAAAGGTTIDHDGDAVTLAAGAGQEITGQTDLQPGTNVTVRVQIDHGATPLLAQRPATVSEDGSFAVDVDLHPAAPGSTGNVTVHHDGRELARAPLAVTGCDGDCPAPPTGTTAPDTPFDVEGDTLTLPAGESGEITGEIDRSAGTNVTVLLRSADNDSPFLRQESTTVGENGTFAVPVNLTSVAAGTDAVATLRVDDETVAEQSVRIENRTAEDTPAEPDRTEPNTDPVDLSDVGLVGGGLTGLLALFGVASRLL